MEDVRLFVSHTHYDEAMLHFLHNFPNKKTCTSAGLLWVPQSSWVSIPYFMMNMIVVFLKSLWILLLSCKSRTQPFIVCVWVLWKAHRWYRCGQIMFTAIFHRIQFSVRTDTTLPHILLHGKSSAKARSWTQPRPRLSQCTPCLQYELCLWHERLHTNQRQVNPAKTQLQRE